MKRFLPVAAYAALLLASTARAGLFDDTEARQQVENLRQEQQNQLESVRRGQLDLASQNEQLRAEVARLRGQLEVLLNKVESVESRQRDFYVDLDSRVRRFEGGNPVSSAETGTSGGNHYDSALRLLKEGKAAEALTALEAYIASNPDSADLPAAHFWAGNAALKVQDVAAANRFFNNVLGRWPNDPAAPDAMLGLANSYAVMGDARNAQRTLQTLVERYPGSNAAQAARQRINRR
jgi:tol-pal system protein YbgF